MAINVEWLNQNALRNYPVHEDMTRSPVDPGGAIIPIQMPNYLIVDFVASIPSALFGVDIYLASLMKAGGFLTYVFNVGSERIFSAVVDISAHARNQSYNMSGYSPYESSFGVLVVGDLSDLETDVADGIYTFTAETCRMEPCVARVDTAGVTSVRVREQGMDSDKLVGDITLAAGSNIRLEYDEANNVITINAISGDNMSDECDCDEYVFTNNIVRTVNGLPVQSVSLIAGENMEISVSGNRLTFKDTGATPCCGCPELEAITVGLKNLELSIKNMQESSAQLNNYISQFVSSVILTAV